MWPCHLNKSFSVGFYWQYRHKSGSVKFIADTAIWKRSEGNGPSSDCHLMERARWHPGKKQKKTKSLAPWLSFCFHCFLSLVLAARHNEYQAAQRRLLRYISLRSRMFLWHKNTTYRDSAIHPGRFPSDILFSQQTALLKMIFTAFLWKNILYGLIGRKKTLQKDSYRNIMSL